MQTIKKIASGIFSFLLWAVIFVSALFAFTTMATRDENKIASIAGYTPMTVESDSMAPTFKRGDLIFIKQCDPTKLQEGDIICFHTIIDSEYVLNTHRIKSIDHQNGARYYTTIGDNNEGIADTHVISDGDIVGIYKGKLPNMGKVMNFMSGSTGFLLIIVLPMLLFFIYQIYHLIMVSMRLKNAVAEEKAEKNADARAALAEAQRLKAEAEEIRAKAEEALKQAKADKEENADE